MIRDNEQVNVFDIERILGDLPLELIKENITTQITDPLTYPSNYCDEVYDAFDEAKDEVGHIDEYRAELEGERNSFTNFLLQEMETKFDLGVDTNSMYDSEIESLVRNCYEFFVIRFRDNMNSFLLNYILSNKMTISSLFDDEYKRKDVTTMNMKKQLDSREDILILSNLPDVINYILNQDITNEDFLNLAVEDGEYVGEEIINANSSFKLAGNFVASIIDEIKFTHNDDIDEFCSNIRLDIMEMLTNDTEEINFQ